MSDDTTNQVPDEELDNDDLEANELSILKQRAQMMGVGFSNNIGLETLKERIAAKIAENEAKANPQNQMPKVNPLADAGEVEQPTNTGKKKTLRQWAMERDMRLIRLRITNLDPKKKDLPGEILTVANEYLGTVSKYVPFGEPTDNGYHVPYCIYKFMKSRKFLSIRTFTDKNNGNQVKVEQRWANEFALEILDPLTPEELKKLGAAQAAAGN